MQPKQTKFIIYFLLVGFFADRLFKFILSSNMNSHFIFSWQFGVIFIIAAIFLLRQKKFFLNPILLTFIGLFSNCLDKLIYGGAVDYINITLGQIKISTNLADVFIWVGLLWLVQTYVSIWRQPSQ